LRELSSPKDAAAAAEPQKAAAVSDVPVEMPDADIFARMAGVAE
jgi:hypothetical protein